jgi:CubicO group peptidase (beta-lactamase class C family)
MRSHGTVRVPLLLALPACTLAASLFVQVADDRADATPSLPSTDVVERVESYLAAERDALDIPGMALAIVHDGEPARVWADGVARPGEPMTPQTPVLLASVSKSLTAVAVMQLVAAGELSLDSPVVRYLPWFRTADRTLSREITVAQLLHHTSGLADGVHTDGALLDDVSVAALERWVRRFAAVKLTFAPGTGFVYSNLNYDLLGLLVETVSGQRFADYMRHRVFAPMGMRRAIADPAQAGDVGAAAGYYRWYGVGYLPTPVPIPARSAPSASMYASVVDLARELRMNLGTGTVDGSQVLSPEATAELHRPASSADPSTSYAMGWFVRPLWEQANPLRYTGTRTQLPMLWEHSGSWSTTATYLGFSPASHIGFALLMNGHDRAAASRQYALTSNVWRLLLDNPPQPLAGPSEDLLTHYGTAIALTLVAAQIALLIQSIAAVRHRRQLTRRRRLIAIVVPLLFDLSLLAFIWLYLPTSFEAPVNAIVRSAPDVGLLILAATALALLWGAPRTVLLARAQTQGRE